MPFSGIIDSSWAWVIPALNAIAFIIIVIAGKWLPTKGAILSIISIFLSVFIFWFVLRDVIETGPQSFSINWITLGTLTITWGILVDHLSITMIGLVTVVSLLVQIYSVEYMKRESRYGWYFASHALFASAMLSLVLSSNLIFLYLSWELVGLGSYLLIGFWYENRAATEAAKKAFITTRIGDVGLLIGILILYKLTGTFEINEIIHVVRNGLESQFLSQAAVNIAALLIFIGAMGKSAQFPFHIWLPDAMEGPTPVSALIHAATMVAAGVFLLARLLPFFEMTPNILLIVSISGLFTFIFAGTLALVMTDLKQILAYSTVSHLGLMMLSLGVLGLSAAIFHLIAHGAAKALLFLCAGSVTHQTQKKDIRQMGNLWRKMPVTTFAFVIGAASLAGIPPLTGFFSKDEILINVFQNGNPLFILISSLGIILSSLYMGRVTLIAFFGKGARDLQNIREPGKPMAVPLIILGFLTLFMGALAFKWGDIYPGFGNFIDSAHSVHINIVVLALSITFSSLGLLLSILVYGVNVLDPLTISNKLSYLHRIIVSKYYIDRFFQWIIDKVVMSFSGLVAVFDRIILNDTGVDGPALLILRTALKIRYFQTGRLYNYALVMSVGVIGTLLAWWLISW